MKDLSAKERMPRLPFPPTAFPMFYGGPIPAVGTSGPRMSWVFSHRGSE